MSTLSTKILRLITYESQSEKLKEEIIAMHHQISSDAEGKEGTLPDVLKLKIQEYEEISEKYNKLFSEILEESAKMKEGYIDLKKKDDQ